MKEQRVFRRFGSSLLKFAQGAWFRVKGNVSSQFLTALLMALPTTGAETTVEVVGELISKPYIEITLRLMEQFGVRVTRKGWDRFVVPGGARYISPGVVYVEGDASSASYFLAAGAIGGGPVRVEGGRAKQYSGRCGFCSGAGGDRSKNRDGG